MSVSPVSNGPPSPRDASPEDLAGASRRTLHWALLIIGICLPSLVTYVYFFVLADASPTTQRVAMGVGKGVQFGLPIVWFLLIRRQMTMSDTEFGKMPARAWLYGTAFGVATACTMFALYHGWLKQTPLFAIATVQIREKVSSLGLASPGSFILLGTAYVLIHSLLEEYYFRWFVFRGLNELVRFRWAVLISSLGFMAHHIIVLAQYFGVTSPATWIFSSCVAVGGAVWAWLYRRTGTLYVPWFSHALIDAGIFAIGFGMLT